MKMIKSSPVIFATFVSRKDLISTASSVSVGFSLVRLRDTPMAPRAADSRLMYFTKDYIDEGVHTVMPDELPSESISRKTSMIWRHNLAALPGRQIRIHVDPTVPDRWRGWFRKGIERWNDAFALIDQPKAVKAVLPEDSDWPRDYDISEIGRAHV